jgi:hypothetical protein
MSKSRAIALAGALGAFAAPAHAIDFTFSAYGDVRFEVPPADGSYLDGDLGKLRFGEYSGSPNAYFEQAMGEVRAQITPEIMATATGRIDPNYGAAADLIEGWVRYRPVSTSDWSWSVRAGAFFPPISLENEEIGWTSFWTLTPSAINSWLGSEIRILGAEGTLQWRRESGTITLIGALFGWNENAGELMTDRGWTLDDRVSGLYSRERVPDESVKLIGGTPPDFTQPFKQFDGNPGWYLDLSWEPEDIGGFEVMRYDNNADPTVRRGGDIAWHTEFWDLGFRKQIDIVTVLAQAMDGTTTIQPAPRFRLSTNFHSAYALVGLDFDEWWFAARVDWYQTRTHAPGPPSPFSEDGHAETISASYQPAKWIRVTGEFLLNDSTRPERVLAGDPARAIEKQFQLALRFYY